MLYVHKQHWVKILKKKKKKKRKEKGQLNTVVNWYIFIYLWLLDSQIFFFCNHMEFASNNIIYIHSLSQLAK